MCEYSAAKLPDREASNSSTIAQIGRSARSTRTCCSGHTYTSIPSVRSSPPRIIRSALVMHPATHTLVRLGSAFFSDVLQGLK